MTTRFGLEVDPAAAEMEAATRGAGGRRSPTLWGEFVPLARKTVLVKLRSKKVGGLGGPLAVAIETLLPALLVLLCSIPSHYLSPMRVPQKLTALHALDAPSWGMEYKGPAERTGSAHVVVSPNSTSAMGLVENVARAAACPPAGLGDEDGSSFYSYFAQPGLPAACLGDAATCRATPECWRGLVGTRFSLVATPAEALDVAMSNPFTVDAVLDLGQVAGILDGSGDDVARYELRLNHTVVPGISPRYGSVELLGRSYARYWWFANLQTIVDAGLIASLAKTDGGAPLLAPSAKAFPQPAHVFDSAAAIGAALFPVVLFLAVFSQSSAVVGAIMEEKEQRLRAGLRLLGLTDVAYWSSLTSVHMGFALLSDALLAAAVAYTYPPTSFWLVLLAFALISISILVFSCFMTTFFTTARLASNVSKFILVSGFFLVTLANVVQPDGGVLLPLACLHPLGAAITFANAFAGLPQSGEGLTWSALGDPVQAVGSFTISGVLCLLAFDALLFGALTWYLDKVMPTGVGQPLPWYFPFVGERRDAERAWTGPEAVGMLPRTSAVEICGLTKEFRGRDGTKLRAVDDFSVSFARGQVTALLGRNGAGKTTTISILTGLIPATSGDAYVHGISVRHHASQLRGHIGVCPQFDVLWPKLSVREHLEIFGSIKGYDRRTLASAIDRAVTEVDLADKLDSWTEELSGGQRRKLSLALAFLGSPEVVFLDEPSSGMDPRARRSAWELIAGKRGETSIVLTTHFMEEADALADNVVIMAEGRLAAAGTPLQLKTRYGVGHVLHCSLTSPAGRELEALEAFVRSEVPDVSMSRTPGSEEVTFVVPTDESAHLPALLRGLSSRRAEFGLNGFGISVTTLESVFLRVSEAAAPGGGPSEAPDVVGVSMPPLERQVDAGGFGRCVLALAKKNWRVLVRDFWTLVGRFLYPTLAIVCAIVLTQPQGTDAGTSVLPLDDATSLGAAPVLVGASATAAAEPQTAALLGSFAMAQALRSNATSVAKSAKPASLAGTIDQELLDAWPQRPNLYGAAFFESVPDAASAMSAPLAYSVLVNETGLHALPATLGVVHSAALRWLTGGTMRGIVPLTSPLPAIPTEVLEVLKSHGETIIAFAMLIFGFGGFASTFARAPAVERLDGSALLFNIAGAPPLAQWIARLFSDMGVFLVLEALVLGAASFRSGAASPVQFVGSLAILIPAYGFSSLSFVYLLQLPYESSETVVSSVDNCVTTLGLVGYMAVKIISSISTIIRTKRLRFITSALRTVMMVVSPVYGLANGLDEVWDYSFPAPYWIVGPKPPKPLSWAVVGKSATVLLMQGAVCFSLLVSIESGWVVAAFRLALGRRSAPDASSAEEEAVAAPLDEDALEEKARVRARPPGAPGLAMEARGVRKVFRGGGRVTVAVRDLWLDVTDGQCFGLLGTNGAGKTTTFRVAIGDESVTRGDLLVAGRSVVRDRDAARRKLSYCPQHSAFPATLSGREVLQLFAELRGVSRANAPPIIEALLSQLGLAEIARRACGTYSGGNKRKLNAAVAILTSRHLTLMDEPSTGMDPASRRDLWGVIRAHVLDHNTIVLSSHSMEECEAVCTRVGIMVKGSLRCIGSVQYLKSKYGGGYSVSVEPEAGRADSVLEMLSAKLPGLRVHGKTPELISFRLDVGADGLGDLVQALEESRAHGVKDYSLNQSSLEEVFLHTTGDAEHA